MKKCVKILLTICTVFCFTFTAIPAIAETIVGVVTMNNEIVTDDRTFYIVEDDEKGSELFEFIGEMVKANGSVRDDEGIKIIKLSDFSVIAEENETSGDEIEKSSDEGNQ